MKTIEVYSTTSCGTVLPYNLTVGGVNGAYALVGMLMKINVYLSLHYMNVMNLFS